MPYRLLTGKWADGRVINQSHEAWMDGAYIWEVKIIIQQL